MRDTRAKAARHVDPAWIEIHRAARFALTGLLATGTHLLVAWWLLAQGMDNVLLVNLLAFLCAFGISFAGNYLWTFRAPGRPWRAMTRFLAIALFGLAANSLLLLALTRLTGLSPFLAVACATCVVPAITYLASRFWGFAPAI